MKTNCTVFAFLGLIVGLVSSSNTCYVGITKHKCSGVRSSEVSTVRSDTCSTQVCGYAKVETSDGCTFVQGFCSDSSSHKKCKNQIYTYASNEAGSRFIEGDCCNTEDDCNKEAAGKTETDQTDHSAAAGVLLGVGVVFWILGCICFWGTCAGIIAAIVCCCQKRKKVVRHVPQNTATTTTTTVTEAQKPVEMEMPHTHPAPGAAAYPAQAPVTAAAVAVAVAVPVNAQPYPATAYPAAVPAYPTQTAPAVAVVPPTATTL